MDSDDYIEPTMMEELYVEAKEFNHDLVECDFFWDYPNESRIDEARYKRDYFHQIRVVSWNKLYRRSIIVK